MQQNQNTITTTSMPSTEHQHLHHIYQPQQQTSSIQLQNGMSNRTLLDQQEVDSFLAQCGLSQYYQVFIEEGFDRPESK
ncbi:hypothetical protein BD408DRAFT_50959 [Parasitella parasitica]|nr:hypothetical protein BD408DRAFT_50959 [Parasitella parasitica]